MSRHATPRGHLALIAVSQGRAQQLDPLTRLTLLEIGWATYRGGNWRLTTGGINALIDANRTAANNRIRSTP